MRVANNEKIRTLVTQTAISMPMKNLIAIVSAVAVGVWAYFGVIERLNLLENKSVLLEKDMDSAHERIHTEVKQNTEFRIKYPRGELGQSVRGHRAIRVGSKIHKSVDRIIKELDDSRNNKVNIEFLKEQMEKALENIEKLKDADREIVYKNGNGDH